MIYLIVAVLTFGATAALVVALTVRQKEQGTQPLRERVGGARPGSLEAPRLKVERETGSAAIG